MLAHDVAALEGLQIEAYGDEALTKRLAETKTDATGKFAFEVDANVSALWVSAAAGGRHDIRTPLLDPWTPRAGRHELFALDSPTTDSAATGVAGPIVTVIEADGRPPAPGSYRIALIERTARACVVHHEAVVPASGRVLLRIDLRRRLTQTQPDLFVRLWTVDRTPILDARTRELRLPLRLATRGSELERVVSAIDTAGVSAAEVTDDDLAYVATRTGVPVVLTRTAREAAKLAGRLGVSTAATYGWLRAAATGTSDVADGVARSRLRNAIPAVTDDERDALARAVDAARRERALAQRGRFDGADLDTVLKRGLPDAKLRGELAADYVSRSDRASLWRDWTGRLGEEAVAGLRFTTEVASLTDHVEVVRELEVKRERKEVTDTKSLAAWSPGRWNRFLTALGVDAPGAFAAVTADRATALQLYSERLALELSLRHPTIAMRAKLDEDLDKFPSWVRPVRRFLQARPDYLLERDPGLATPVISRKHPALPGLRAIFRLLRLPASPWQMSTLLSNGFTSARAIARIAPATFLDRISAPPSAIAQLLDLHDRAVSVATKAVLLRANLGRGQYVNGQPVLGGPTPNAAATRTQALITWDTLFGDADRARCACTTCRSVYSPASYLVSLLETLDAHPKGPACSVGPSAGGTLPANNLAELFVARRRDVHGLLLSCENTNVAVPTIDLVNELLEELVAPGQAPTVCQSGGTQGTAAERRAEPQALSAPATVGLETATIPWTLPYSIHRHRGLLALDQLGVPLHEANDLINDLTLAPSGCAPGLPGGSLNVDAAADQLRARNLLGATIAEWEILGTPADDANLGPRYWGALQPGVIAARALEDATGLGFNALFGLMATRFLRGGSTGPDQAVTFIAHGTAAVGTCAVDELDVQGLTWPLLDRLHRFARLMRLTGLTADELDDLLLVVGATTARTAQLNDAALVAIAHAVGLCRRAGRTITELLPLFGHVSDDAPLRTPVPDEPRPLPSPFRKVFDRSPAALANAIQSLAGQAQGDAATTMLAGLTGLDHSDALASVAPVLGATTVVGAMSSPGDLTFLTSSARRIELLASLTSLEAEDVLALWRLSGLDLLPSLATRGPTLGLPTAIWRFLRFANSARGWTLAPREVARLCGLATASPGEAPDIGAALLELQRAFDALDAELPSRNAPSRDDLAALIARVGVPSGRTGAEPAAVATLLDVTDRRPFAPPTATLVELDAPAEAALDPAVLAALDLGGIPRLTAAALAVRVAAAVGGLGTPIASLEGPLTALLPAPPGLPAPVGPQPTLDERRQALADAIEAGVEAAAIAAARTAGLGTERAAAAYRVPVDNFLATVRALAAAGTVEGRINVLTVVIRAVDQQTGVQPATPDRAAAEAVIAGFLARLSDAVGRGERELAAALAAASLTARAEVYDRLRTHMLRLRRETAAIQWLSGYLGVDQDRTAYLVRDLLRHPRDPARPMVAALTEGDGARVGAALVRARYANSVASDAVEVSVHEAGLDLDWQGRPPAPGISATAFVADLGLGQVTLDAGDVLAVRTSYTLLEVAVTAIPGVTTTSTPAPAAGWIDVFTAVATGPIALSLRLGPPVGVPGGPPPRVEVARRTGGQLIGPLHSDARRGLDDDLRALERVALAARGFAAFGPETWSRLGGQPDGAPIDLAGLVGAPSVAWLISYLRLDALRRLRERCEEPATWSAYLDARGAGTGLSLALWSKVQGLSDVEAAARRELYQQIGLGDLPVDELVLAAGEVVAARANDAALPPSALVTVGKPGPVSAAPAIPRGSLSDAELDAFGLAALRSQEPARRARELLQAVHDPVRLRYRDALVAWLLRRETAAAAPRFFDCKSLNQYLLADTAVTCCDATSRVQFACAAIQAFVEGILDRSIEPSGIATPYWLGSLEALDREWTWKRHYRLWEANMNLFLTPENWLEDETRGDETHAFRELREALRQGELTSPAAEVALTGYLRRLHELSRLEIVATVDQRGDCEAIPLGFRRGDLVGTHVIGRTRSLPARYFYRRRLPAPESRWLPWEPLDVDIDGDAFDLVIHGGRLWFSWATFRPGPEQAADLDADAKAAGQNAPKDQTMATATVKHTIRLHWVERVHGAWQGRGSAPTPIKVGPLTAAEIPADVFRFALRSRTERERLVIHPVWRSHVETVSPAVETVPPGLLKLYRWVNPLIRTTYLTTDEPSQIALIKDVGLRAVQTKVKALEAIAAWETFSYDNTFVAYVLPRDSTFPGAIELVGFVNEDTGDILYATDPAEQNRDVPWHPIPMRFKVLPAGAATTYTQPLRRFSVRQQLPNAATPEKKWFAHNYGFAEPIGYTKPPDDEEGAPGGECRLWTTDEAVDAPPPPQPVAVWRGEQAFDLGPAGDVMIRASTPPTNLAYATSGDLYADGLGYLAPHGGQPLRLPLGGTLREALGDMDRVYRIVMESAHGRPSTSGEPRFVDELREQTREEGGDDPGSKGPLRTFFCERVETVAADVSPGGGVGDIGGEIDVRCLEIGIHEIGNAGGLGGLGGGGLGGGGLGGGGLGGGGLGDGGLGGGVVDPLPDGVLFQPALLHDAITRAHSTTMRTGETGTALAEAFEGMGMGRGPTLGVGLPPRDGGGSGGPLLPPGGGLLGGPLGGGIGSPIVIPDDITLPAGGSDVALGWDPRQCNLGSLGGLRLTTRIANLVRRASFLTGSSSLPANALGLFGTLTVTTPPKELWAIRPFHHPLTASLFGRLAVASVPGLMELAGGQAAVPFLDQYAPNAAVVAGAPTWAFPGGWRPGGPLEPRDELDYSDTGAFGDYNWELTYHAPMLIGRRLTQLGRFEDARRWFHLVFDPRSAATDARTAFRCRPLREAANASAQDILTLLSDPAQTDESLLRQLRRFTNEPFRPHLIARARPVAYAKATILAYIDMLIAWGDSLFRTDDRTTIEEARRRYEEAERLLGDVPEVLAPRAEVGSTCYAQLEADGRTGAGVLDPLVEIEGLVQPSGIESAGAVSGGVPGGASLTLYFCFAGNDRFDTLKATIADRLLKIRACQNLEGIERVLSLYGNKIDPGLIARAVAAGVSPADVFNELNAPLPRFRFKELIQRAKEVCADARGLGQALLSSLEKKDSESQQQLRAGLDLEALNNLKQTKAKQLEEAQRAQEAADAAKAPVEARKTFYSTREFMNADERTAAGLTWAAMGVRAAAAAAGFIASSISVAPDFTQGVHAQLMASGTSTLTQIGGGNKAATVFQAVGAVANLAADVLGTVAGSAREQGGYRRRSEDWGLQVDLAGKELAVLEKQAAAAAVRAAIAQIEVDNHEAQIGHAEATKEFLRSKFTNAELYGWMSSRLSGLYYEQFRLAYDTLLQAQRAWQYELGTDERLVTGSPWEPGKKGLLAADELMARIHQLEVRFDQKKPYDHAKSPDIRLSEVAPRALIQLRNTGACEFEIPEDYFDSIEPGGCFRRWKAIAVTIPCVRGPSTVLDGRLTLLAHSRRPAPGRKAPAAPPADDPDALLKGTDLELSIEVGGRDYIELTHGNRDFGLPEGAGQEGWRLPFEGTGAISRWRLELPLETNTFDRRSLTDVVLHTVYTARNGSPLDRAAARAAAHRWPREILLDIPALFPDEWHTFKRTGTLATTLTPDSLRSLQSRPGTRAAMELTVALSAPPTVHSVRVERPDAGSVVWKRDSQLGAIQGALSAPWDDLNVTLSFSVLKSVAETVDWMSFTARWT